METRLSLRFLIICSLALEVQNTKSLREKTKLTKYTTKLTKTHEWKHDAILIKLEKVGSFTPHDSLLIGQRSCQSLESNESNTPPHFAAEYNFMLNLCCDCEKITHLLVLLLLPNCWMLNTVFYASLQLARLVTAASQPSLFMCVFNIYTLMFLLAVVGVPMPD